MAKDNLVAGELWEKYSNKVNMLMSNPKNAGVLTEEDAKKLGGKLIIADYGAESCGDAVRLFWIVDESSDIILEAKFKSFGCGTAIASSDAMSELCKGKTVEEARKITNIDVEQYLRDDPDTPAVPPQKMHCSVMAYDVIKKAAQIYSGASQEDLDNDIVCECARVTRSTIEEVVRLNNLTTIEEIGEYTKAGTFCGSCIRPGGHEKRDVYLVDILNDILKERARDEGRAKSNFTRLTNIQKYKIIDAALDKYIRDMLKNDGGNIEIVDVEDSNDGKVRVYARYLGACSGCASGSTGTLYAIENILQDKVYDGIEVVPV